MDGRITGEWAAVREAGALQSGRGVHRNLELLTSVTNFSSNNSLQDRHEEQP